MSVSNDETPLVSVVVPAYNATAHIRETLASALAQTYRHIEIIVVDDGSTDGTSELVASIAATDPRIRLLRQANKGQAGARNTGLRQARGSLIATLDADDLWHPTKIAKQVAKLQDSGPQVGLVYVWSAMIDERSRVIARHPGALFEGDVYAALVLYSFMSNGSTPLFRRSCLAEAGLYNELYYHCADTLFYLAVAERYDVAVVPEFLTGYRRNPDSLSGGDPLGLLRDYRLMIADAGRRHPELPAKLFRWSRIAAGFGAAGKCLRRGQLVKGSLLLLRMFFSDPALVCTLYRYRRPRGRPGVHYFDLPPEPAGARDPEPFGSWRHDYVTSLRIKRPTSRSETLPMEWSREPHLCAALPLQDSGYGG